MMRIGKTLVSDELAEEKFVCDLKRCKGACCVAGESGAPLERNEIRLLKSNYKAIEPYMTAEGVDAVAKKGMFTIDSDGDRVTPLIGKQGACAFAVQEKGITACAIEQAYAEGRSSFQKPISCHLYPVRITAYKAYDAVNYHAWDICADACRLGASLRVPVYRFVKDALVRKYGMSWYEALCKAVAGTQVRKRKVTAKST